jgi:hydroxymethylbilane synthase
LPLRGNVETRLRKLKEGQYDAILLSLAGLKRLGLAGQLAGALYPMEIEGFVPAAGQAALALQCRRADAATRALLDRLNDPDSFAALAAERSVVARLRASCHSALGVHVRRIAGAWHGDAMAADVQGQRILRVRANAPSAEAAANELYRQLAEQGAGELLQVGAE